MTVAEGRKLGVGDRVAWSDGALGTVREISYAAVKVQWDDDQWCLLTFADKGTPWRELNCVVNEQATA